MALDPHTPHPGALQDRLGSLSAAVSGSHTYFGETIERTVNLPLSPEAEEQGWDGQNEVLKVEEHGVKPRGAGGDLDNTILLRPSDLGQ
jgi:hypothetical protein